MTAGHVIHPDNFWDDPKNRLIYINLALVLNNPSAVGDVLATFKANPVTKLVLPTRVQLNFDELAGNCTFLGKRSALVTHKPEDMAVR